MSLTVVGSLALDTIETPFGKREYILGGSATFISTSASYFSNNINLVGIVGYDFPKEEVEFLKSKGINTSGLEIRDDLKTFHWHGMNERDSIHTELNAFEVFNPILSDDFSNSEFLCLGNVDPVIQRKVLMQMKHPKLKMIDTMNFWIEGKPEEFKETLKYADTIVINDSEARLITGETNLFVASRKILTMGPRVIIVKKGEHGAFLITQNTIFSVPAIPLSNVIDPTGAGDTFAGGFMGWLAKTNDISDENLKIAVAFGTVMASLVVQDFSLEGIRNLKKDDVMTRFNRLKNLTTFDNATI